MIAGIQMFEVRCDAARHEPTDWEWPLGRTPADALEQAAGDGWSTDGENLNHCQDCPVLELTPAAAAEAARKLAGDEVPLIAAPAAFPDLEAARAFLARTAGWENAGVYDQTIVRAATRYAEHRDPALLPLVRAATAMLPQGDGMTISINGRAVGRDVQ